MKAKKKKKKKNWIVRKYLSCWGCEYLEKSRHLFHSLTVMFWRLLVIVGIVSNKNPEWLVVMKKSVINYSFQTCMSFVYLWHKDMFNKTKFHFTVTMTLHKVHRHCRRNPHESSNLIQVFSKDTIALYEEQHDLFEFLL